MRCYLCEINIDGGEKAWDMHSSGKRHKLAVYLSEKDEMETAVFIKGFLPCANHHEIMQYLESEVGKVLKSDMFPDFLIVEFENRSSAEEILKRKIHYCGYELLIKSKRSEFGNDEPEEEIDYNQVLEVLEKSFANATNYDFEDQLSILLEQIVLKDPERGNKINELCRTLEELFHPIFPGCQATAFGSAVTGLSFVCSDIDIVLWVNGSDKTLHPPEDLVNVGTALMLSRQDQFSKIHSIPRAKTPIIKFVHIPTRMKCDVSFHNTFSVQNSSIIAFVISSDERIRKIMLFIKFWAQKHCVAFKTRLNNYTIALLVIFYLQQGRDPLLPAIRDLRDPQAPEPVNSWDTNFRVNRNYKFNSNNKESTENLVAGFFRFYAETNLVRTVISPLLGLLIPRENFLPENLDKLPAELEIYKSVIHAGGKPLLMTTPVCVQDPFELNHNVAHNVCGKVAYFWYLCNAVKDLFLHSPDGPRLPPLTKLLSKDLLLEVPNRKYINQNSLTIILISNGYLTEQYLGSYSIDVDRFSIWTNIVINFIEVVFQDIFKLKITWEKPVGDKVQKTAISDNVHSQRNVLICHGTHDIYHNRKKFRRLVDGNHTWFENLALVSEKMIAMNEAPCIDLKFRCILKVDKKNDSLMVKLESLNQSVDFAFASSYISQVLVIWLDKAFKRGLALKYSSKSGQNKIVNSEEIQPDKE